MADNSTMHLMPKLAARCGRHTFLYRGAVNQIVCAVAALTFWLLAYATSNFFIVWLYSVAIGNLIWLFIDGGRELAARLMGHTDGKAWPGPAVMVATVVVGTVAGYELGTWGVDTLLGQHSPSLFDNQPAAVITVLIATAATYFFYSRERLHAEIADAEAARRLAVESQLKLLESQLKPHMLFNTLANLRVLIGLDPPRAQAMLDHLIAYLRSTLHASRNGSHALSAEFERAADYLALMSVRMGPRLSVKLDLPEALRSVPVPPLLLQPLVENAIQHGLEPKVEGGRIEISARAELGQLVLTVRDTGLGLAAQTDPAQAQAQAHTSTGTGYGTVHVRQRLAALHGKRAWLELAPAPGGEGGTLATVSLPLQADMPAP
jgi:signal transduction histidine kinase